MFKAPKKSKYRAPHLYLSNRGLKGTKRTYRSQFLIKAKKEFLISAKQRENCRVTLSRMLKKEQVKD